MWQTDLELTERNRNLPELEFDDAQNIQLHWVQHLLAIVSLYCHTNFALVVLERVPLAMLQSQFRHRTLPSKSPLEFQQGPNRCSGMQQPKSSHCTAAAQDTLVRIDCLD
jgi:hypothetical protein